MRRILEETQVGREQGNEEDTRGDSGEAQNHKTRETKLKHMARTTKNRK